MDAPPEQPKVIEVAEGLYVRQEIDNMGWFDLGGFGIVVDALERPELEDEVFTAIAQTLGETPIRYVLNTHTHHDHTALNDAFRRRAGAEVVNLRTAEIDPADGRWFEGDRRRAQMLPLPGCHTPDDCCVHLPDDGTLFVGDLFGWGLIPVTGPLTDDAARRLEKIYSRLIDFDAATVVPGHGPVCTTAELRRMMDYVRWLREGVLRARETGTPAGAVGRELPPPEDMRSWWRLADWKHEDSLGKVLQGVETGDLTR